MIAPILAALVALQTPADTVVLPPLTVTATRQATSLFAVPLAITQLKKRELFGTTGYGLNDALALVPGVVAQSRYGNQDVRITIRGYGARGAGDRSNAGTSRGIRVLLDGFPETEPDGRTSFDGIDLAAAHAIEVVRSNASAVWGNAAGGVVSISTLPEAGDPRVTLEPMAGSFGLRRYTARSAFGLGGSGGGVLGASFVRSVADGWRLHSASERSLLNVSVRAPVGEKTQLGVYGVASHNIFRIPGPLTAVEVAADARQSDSIYQARDERRDNRVARLGLTFEHQASDRVGVSALLYANPKALQRSERGTFRDFTRYHVGGNGTVRIATPFGVPGTLLVGGDYALQDGPALFYNLTPQGTRGDTLLENKAEGSRNAGVFVTQELSLGGADRVTLALGARYDDITYDYRDYRKPLLNARRSFTGLTPKVGVTYRLTPQHSIYVSAGGGIEVPAGNETDPVSTFGQDTIIGINPLLDPIRSTTVEIGTKQLWVRSETSFIREISYDVALYHTAVANEIVPYRGGQFYFTAGRVRRRGVEVGARFATRAGVALQAALTWNAHQYTRYLVDSVHYDTTKAGIFADFSGNRVVGIPAFTGSVSLDIAPAVVKPLRVRFGVESMSSFFADDANQVKVASYRIANVTVGTDQPLVLGKTVGVSGFVTIHNLFDRRYIASAFLNPDVVGGVPVAFEPGLPRNVVVGVSFVGR